MRRVRRGRGKENIPISTSCENTDRAELASDSIGGADAISRNRDSVPSTVGLWIPISTHQSPGNKGPVLVSIVGVSRQSTVPTVPRAPPADSFDALIFRYYGSAANGVPANHEFLSFVKADFGPGAGALACFVSAVASFRAEAFEALGADG
jgi:hypothetical protein